MKLPTWSTYCQNTIAVNALVFDLGPIAVYFSYKTPIAYTIGVKTIVCQNEWGPTTGKHLNAIDGGTPQTKKDRIPRSEFESLLSNALENEATK